MTTLRDALTQGRRMLIQAGQDSDRLDTQVLLEHVVGIDRGILYTHPEREVTAEQEQQFLSLIERRMHGEPIAYILGYEEFYGLDFFVDKRVLIPRPETELLVERALQLIRNRLDNGQTPLIADIGTGSGAIPITLAVEESRLPYLYAIDISEDALAVAQQNCQRHSVEQRVRLLHGDLLTPLPEPVDILIANLPYVGTDEVDVMTRDVLDYEPHLALFSGPNGLDLLQHFFEEAHKLEKLKLDGMMLLEIGYCQREPLTKLLEHLWPAATVTFQKDYAGWDRVLQVML
ncbi:MAG: peptide chain release factor N(5)-glutamine methyltransferase [Ktedonobacteraceae bacterium]